MIIYVGTRCSNFLWFFFSEEFDNYMQQDAHEFLNFLINHINEIILGKKSVPRGLDKANSCQQPLSALSENLILFSRTKTINET